MTLSGVMMSLGITSVLTGLLLVWSWRQRHIVRAMSLSMTALMVAITWWLVVYTLEIATNDALLKQAANTAKFLAIVVTPVAWFVFAAAYVGYRRWLAPRSILLLSVFPAITTLVMGTNDLHHWMWQERWVENVGEFSVMNSVYGPWFWLHSAYSYFLILTATVLLFRMFSKSPRLYRRQLIALLIAVVVPMVGNATTIFGSTYVDLTPFAFAVTGLAFAWGLLRYQLLDVAPIARNAVIDGMTDGMLILDQQERVIDMNPAAERILDSTAAQAIGQPALTAFPGVAEHPRLIQELRASEAVHAEFTSGHDAQRRYVDVHMSPLRNQQGQLTGRLLILRDITARRQAEQRIQAQNQALIQANHELALARKQAEHATQLKSQFLATMSHELRTPLNAIIGYTEIQLAGMTGALNEEQVSYQERVLANAEHLLSLINDVLDISKIEAGRMELVARPLVLRTWLEDIAAQNQVLAQTKGLQFDVELDDDLPTKLIADSARLKQVVINLLANAIKFTEKGRVRLLVQQHDADAWEIVVADTGIGIAAHAQETIFDEFRQVDGSSRRQHGGTGLGLAITRKLVLMMGGSIRVKSALGAGSTFTVVLPLKQENVEDKQEINV